MDCFLINVESFEAEEEEKRRLIRHFIHPSV